MLYVEPACGKCVQPELSLEWRKVDLSILWLALLCAPECGNVQQPGFWEGTLFCLKCNFWTMCGNKLTSSSVFLRGMEEAYFLKFPELGRVEAGEPMVHMEVFSLSPDREAGRQQGGLGGQEKRWTWDDRRRSTWWRRAPRGSPGTALFSFSSLFSDSALGSGISGGFPISARRMGEVRSQ